jgi:CheY-like chemotaxis protein
MTDTTSLLSGKRILAVDDEIDVLETIEDLLDTARVDTARDYHSASEKIRQTRYDLVILDIMGVDGLTLLEEAVARQIPAVMLTAHAVNQDALMDSIRKGAIAYLPKETLVELDGLLSAILGAHEQGQPSWKLLFDRLGDYFDERFGKGWRDKNPAFWSDFDRTYQVGRGIQQRLQHDQRVKGGGV